jgi:hypothetical protein
MEQGRRKQVWLAGTWAALAVACGAHHDSSSVTSLRSAVSLESGSIVVGERTEGATTNGLILRSSDNRVWSEASLPAGAGPLRRVAVGHGVIVAVGRSPIITSPAPDSGGHTSEGGASGSAGNGGVGGSVSGTEAGYQTLENNNAGGAAGGTGGSGGLAGSGAKSGAGGTKVGGAGGASGQSGAAGGAQAGQGGAKVGGAGGAAGGAPGGAGQGGAGASGGPAGQGGSAGAGGPAGGPAGGAGGQAGGQGGQAGGQGGASGGEAGPAGGGAGGAAETGKKSGVILVSVKGQDWSSASLPPAEPLVDVVSGDGGFVAAGEQGLHWSSDGSVWIQQPVSGASGWRSLGAGNGRFVAVGERVYSSTDGRSWQLATSVPAGAFSLVRFVQGHFYAVTPGGGLYGGSPRGCTLVRSTDGLAWQAVAAPIPACAADIATQTEAAILAAGDALFAGTTAESGAWVQTSSRPGESFVAVQASHGGWVAATQRSIQTSADGRTWIEAFSAR